jgi:hypothetical protein
METMTQEDKELLLKDLCARLPYGVKVKYQNEVFDIEHVCPMYEEVKLDMPETWTIYVSDVKPYLFPLSSMTKEQKEELYKIGWYLDEDKIYSCFRNYDDENYKTHTDCFELINWCYKNHFDIYGLIPKGLAIDATGLNIY